LAAEIVLPLADRPRREVRGAAGLKRVREHFSAEAMVRNTLRIYERIVQSKAAGSEDPALQEM
jgi:hypothetical protein